MLNGCHKQISRSVPGIRRPENSPKLAIGQHSTGECNSKPSSDKQAESKNELGDTPTTHSSSKNSPAGARKAYSDRVCYKCERSGHIARYCRVRKNCYQCGGIDHLSKGCPVGIKCYKCGGCGHVSKTCQYEAYDKVCHICKDPTHFAVACPQAA